MFNKIINKADDLINNIQNRMALKKMETESGDHLVEVLGTIIVAVALLLIFKGRIKDLFNNGIDKTECEVTTLWTK